MIIQLSCVQQLNPDELHSQIQSSGNAYRTNVTLGLGRRGGLLQLSPRLGLDLQEPSIACSDCGY